MAVATMVWSSDANSMASITPAMTMNLLFRLNIG
jgi:hypothetical protein